MKSTYLRYLELSHAVDRAFAPLSTIDETAKHLLQVIALSHAQGKAMTVTDAMALTAIASPATVQRKLDDLREVGLIEQIFEGKNRRTKYLVPTPMASTYFAKLGQAMQHAYAAE
jgi:DNA-binding MarR family transcriptional regulator